MRYIGSKVLMLDNIANVITQCTHNVHTITDIFAGTGAVSKYLKNSGYNIISNDILYMSYVLNKGALEMNAPISQEIRDIIAHLNNLTTDNCPWFDIESAFVYNNYSPTNQCKRMYFQRENALKIDLIRQEIDRIGNQITEAEYYYLLALLLNAVPYVSNITGTYGAYLKFWDKRTYNHLTLEEIEIKPSNIQCQCYNLNAMDLAPQIECDLVYLDPPYNGRQYLPNYHILETIARYDAPAIKGVTGVRVDPMRMSDFCKKGKAALAFQNLFDSLKCKYILLSYNNEGLLKTEEMSQILCNSGKRSSFMLFQYDYRRYKNKIPNNKEGLKEQLYFIEK